MNCFDKIIDRRRSGCYKWDETGMDDFIPMWVADMDFQTAPCIIEALKKRIEHGVFGYTLVQDEYYDAIIGWFKRRYNWCIEREWIQYTSGVVPAISVIIKALCQPGEKVIIQTPIYNCFFSSIRNNECTALYSPLKRIDLPFGEGEQRLFTYEMDFEDLEEKAKDPASKLLLLCNPHNPAGRVWSKDDLKRVNEICKRHGVIVVSDEIHNELCLDGRRYTPFASVSEECLNNSITCTSPSKSFNTAGLQIANIICNNEELRQKIDRAININEVCDVNPFGVAGLIAAYNDGEQWLTDLCQYLTENYNALKAFFKENLPEYPITIVEGTYLVWVDISSTEMNATELTERLLNEARVQVNNGEMYDSIEGNHFIRLNIACPRSQMMEGLKRIADFLSHLK